MTDIRPVARWPHTAVLISVFVVLTVAGAWFQSAASHNTAIVARPASGALKIYLSLLLTEAALVWYVWRGLRSTNSSIRELIGGQSGIAAIARDVVIAAAMWGVWKLIKVALSRATGPDHAASVSNFLPRSVPEIVTWVALSCAAGFAEELVFRGYLLRQFEAWTRRPWLAIILQALLFGISHGYQGVSACLSIALFGVLFGLVARWRRDVRPGMIAHAATDILAGLFRI
jgi:hypothetical protein